MLDFGHLPTGNKSDLQIFNAFSTVTNAQWHTWTKPRGYSMCSIFVVGGAGGGGGGQSGASGARGGGGGGSGCAVLLMIFRLRSLPDTLYIQVGYGGTGGAGGATGVTGSNGVPTYVAIAPDTASINVLMVHGAPTGGGGAAGGSAGTGGAGAAGGTGGNSASIANMPLGNMGLLPNLGLQPVAGSGGAGGSGIAAANLSISATGLCCMGGGGGSGVNASDTVGGGINALSPTLAGSPLIVSDSRPLAAAAGGPGQNGTQLWRPFFSFGGLGGGGSVAGTGGAGGNGAIGGGGGGGGAGVTGGKGGDGGPGIAIINCW